MENSNVLIASPVRYMLTVSVPTRRFEDDSSEDSMSDESSAVESRMAVCKPRRQANARRDGNVSDMRPAASNVDR